MADTFFVGQTNNPYMVAGTSLILPVFNITLCLAGLAGVGGGSLISRLLGQKREDEARRVSAFSLYLGLAVAALFSVGAAVFMRPLLGLLGAGENTFEYARQYAMCVIVLGGVPTVLSNVLANLIRSVGLSREASAGIILGGLLNIALDPLFMFVLLPKGVEVLGAGDGRLPDGAFVAVCIVKAQTRRAAKRGVNTPSDPLSAGSAICRSRQMALFRIKTRCSLIPPYSFGRSDHRTSAGGIPSGFALSAV